MCTRVFENLYVACGTNTQAKETGSCDLSKNCFKIRVKDTDRIISYVVDFCYEMVAAEENERQSRIVVCPTRDDPRSIAEACFYLGTYLILYKGATYDAVVAAFSISDLSSHVDERNYKDNLDGWRALQHAMCLGWFVPPHSHAEPMMDVHELAHYSHQANGGVHLSVPGELLFFPTPADLSEDREWADYTADDGSIVRRFSARFYAELFQDLDVSVVACLGTGSAAAAAASRRWTWGWRRTGRRCCGGWTRCCRWRGRRRGHWRCTAGRAADGRGTLGRWCRRC